MLRLEVEVNLTRRACMQSCQGQQKSPRIVNGQGKSDHDEDVTYPISLLLVGISLRPKFLNA